MAADLTALSVYDKLTMSEAFLTSFYEDSSFLRPLLFPVESASDIFFSAQNLVGSFLGNGGNRINAFCKLLRSSDGLAVYAELFTDLTGCALFDFVGSWNVDILSSFHFRVLVALMLTYTFLPGLIHLADHIGFLLFGKIAASELLAVHPLKRRQDGRTIVFVNTVSIVDSKRKDLPRATQGAQEVFFT